MQVAVQSGECETCLVILQRILKIQAWTGLETTTLTLITDGLTPSFLSWRIILLLVITSLMFDFSLPHFFFSDLFSV